MEGSRIDVSKDSILRRDTGETDYAYPALFGHELCQHVVFLCLVVSKSGSTAADLTNIIWGAS